MSKIQVLVVDDSVVVRKLLSTVLSQDPCIEVSGTAANGKIALQKLSQAKFDLVTLDIEMPEMDGLQALAEIRKIHPTLPVVMFSNLTEKGAAATIDALYLGASDYVTKPSGVGSMNAGMEQIRDELVPRIKALCLKSLGPDRVTERKRLSTAEEVERARNRKSRIEILGIGVSTGGPNALAAILPRLPKDFPVPILIVQHMPPMFTKFLAERLAAKSLLPVEEASSGIPLGPGRVWIAPGDFHMTVEKMEGIYRIQTDRALPENSCRPSVDVLFRSISRNYGKCALVTVLTGMGQDGLRGAKEVYEAGGEIYVQDEKTSVVWGMPGSVVNAGIADKVLALEQIPVEWMKRISQGR